MDNLTKSQRSYVMSQVKSKNTKPELLVRKSLFSIGYRYRLYQNLPGKPDLTLKKFKTVVFIHGCFWHNHKDCKLNRLPKDNSDYWLKKKLLNQKHDLSVQRQLMDQGWRILIIWECACKKNLISKLLKLITEFLHNESLKYQEISLKDYADFTNKDANNEEFVIPDYSKTLVF